MESAVRSVDIAKLVLLIVVTLCVMMATITLALILDAEFRRDAGDIATFLAAGGSVLVSVLGALLGAAQVQRRSGNGNGNNNGSKNGEKE